MDFPNNSLRILLLLSFLFTTILFLFLWSPSSLQDRCCLSSSTSNLVTMHDDLASLLNRASMPNKTLIITVVNRAYVQQSVEGNTTMLDMFLESFWFGEATRPLLHHLLIVAVDDTAYQRCRFKRLHCYLLRREGVELSGEKVYMSHDFISMMWTRTLFLLDVLNRGYSFVFTDTDVMWLRNPFQQLSRNDSLDLQISVDRQNTDQINTGFYYVRPNSRTISLFNTWYSSKDNSTGLKEQDVLQMLLQSGDFHKLGIGFRLLDTIRFSGFCEDSPDVTLVTTVHSNCCRHIAAKINDLTVVLRDWKRYKAAPNLGANFSWSPHQWCLRSWDDSNYNPLP